ncbi:class I SAM-dependent methyltransferase [Acidisoma silvae]|uniref:Methyltransferase domain-containing protein n=1 Tax=Acidisoma silvae TaxID=2802396 RepID=A0A963YUE2_9PROT|nr:methyltransferase domain-containing protein [Acidisoma silvae]MCB8877258.1 methyltransferase domain-containing protein [Acidisoma silvae]
MALDVHAAADFYATAQGIVAARLIRQRIAGLWPDMTGRAVLGLGYAPPYLRGWREDARLTVAVTPAQYGAARWPVGAANLTCMAEEDALPFAGPTFDRVLLIHGLEGAENARRLLREIWRVMKDDGRLMVVTPNRRGMWAYFENTPFGQGTPYSAGQVGRLLSQSLFRVEHRETALFLPPLEMRLLLRSNRLFERVGHWAVPQFAGVTIAEAVKDVYSAVPTNMTRSRRFVLAEAP